MCKYCEDTSYEREEANIKEYSYPHLFGDLSDISLHYKFDVIAYDKNTKYDKNIKVIPHFCPMCGNELKKEAL